MKKTYSVTQVSYGTVTVDVPAGATEEEIRKIVDRAVMNREADFYEDELQDYSEADGYDDEENYPYLSQARDFDQLKEHYSEETLTKFEAAICECEESENPEDFVNEDNPIILWYGGLLDTNDLYDCYEEITPYKKEAFTIESEQLEELRTIVSTLKQNAEKRVGQLNATGERYYGDCDDPQIQYWRGSGDAYRVMEGHIIALLKTEEAQTRNNHTIWETYGQFQTDDSTRIICPKCGCKVNVSRADGDIRGITHCKCKTNGKPTTFKFVEGGGLVYTDEKGITIGL